MYRSKLDIDKLIEEQGISSKEDQELIRLLFDDSLTKKEHNTINESFGKTVDMMLANDDCDTKINKLKILIENIIYSDENGIELHENQEKNSKNYKKTMDYIEKYYQDAMKKIERIKDKNYGEKLIISLLKKVEMLKLYVDNEIEKDYIYGDLSKMGQDADLTLFKNDSITLKRVANYQTGKSKKVDGKKIVAKFSPEKISKYRFDFEYEKGKIATMDFFGYPEIGDKILEGKRKAFYLMMAAACRAKEDGRNFIGKISNLEGTYITTYDENLEEAVKDLIIKEQQEEEMKENREKDTTQDENQRKDGEQQE